MAKVYNTKPSAKQKLAFKNTCENLSTGESLEKALLKANYKPSIAKHPQIVLQSKGFKQLCQDNGLSESIVISMLAQDLKDKPRDRSKELTIACKMLGLFKADNEQQSKQIDIPDGVFFEIIRGYKLKDNGSTKAIQGEVVE